MGALSSDRVMLAYINSNFISAMAGNSGSSYDMSSLDMLRSAAVSLAVVDQGLKLDVVTQYNLDQLSEEQKALLSSGSAGVETARYFPSGSLFYLTGANLDQAWSVYRDLIVQSLGDEGDFNDSMDMLAEQIGFNPDTDLMPLMDGSYALGFYEDSNSFLDQSANIPLGYLGVFETSQAGEVQSLVDDMANTMGDQLGVNVNDTSSGDLTMYEFEVTNEVVASIGVDGKSLFIGTNSDAVDQAALKSGGLADDPAFKDIWSSFPNSMKPVLYVDLAQAISMLEGLSSTDLGVLTPITAFAVASSPLNGDTMSSSMLLVVTP
jgi:hypothetical protein